MYWWLNYVCHWTPVLSASLFFMWNSKGIELFIVNGIFDKLIPWFLCYYFGKTRQALFLSYTFSTHTYNWYIYDQLKYSQNSIFIVCIYTCVYTTFETIIITRLLSFFSFYPFCISLLTSLCFKFMFSFFINCYCMHVCTRARCAHTLLWHLWHIFAVHMCPCAPALIW